MLAGGGLAEAASLSTRLPPQRPPGLAPPVAPPAAPSETPQPAPSTPAPSASSCLRLLTEAGGNRVRPVRLERAPASPDCAVDEPVLVEALAPRHGGARGAVAFTPPVTLSCAMATQVWNWLDDAILPLARGHFEADLTGLQVGGGHECRRRNRAGAGPLSEHATGRALDIFAFDFAGGRRVTVEKPDGPLPERFLRAVRQSACGAFMTTLGPGSDAAHADHIHIDIQPRRSAASRFCQ